MKAWAAKRYELTAEIYKAHYYQDPDTGAFVTEWDYDNPIRVKASGGSIKPYQSLETFGAQYRNEPFLQLFIPRSVDLLDRIGKVRNRAGEILYVESQGGPTIFDVYGVFPEIDQQGRTVDYRVVTKRAQVQG